MAAENGKIEIVAWLLNDRISKAALLHSNQQGKTALDLAYKKKHTEVIKILLEPTFKEVIKQRNKKAMDALVAKYGKEYSDAYYYRGMLYSSLGLLTDAIADFNIAIQRFPNHSLYHYERAIAYQAKAKNEKADLQQALSDFTRAIELKANHAYSYYHRGVVNRRLGHYKTALADLDY